MTKFDLFMITVLAPIGAAVFLAVLYGMMVLAEFARSFQ
jgi:hypothetical protein